MLQIQMSRNQRFLDRLDQMNSDLDRIMGGLDEFLDGAGVSPTRIDAIGSIIDVAYEEIADGLRDAGHSVERNVQTETESIMEETESESTEEREESLLDNSVDYLEEDPLVARNYDSPPRVHWTDGEVFLRTQEHLDDDVDVSPRRLSWSSVSTVDHLTYTSRSLRDWAWYYQRARREWYAEDSDSDTDTWVDDVWVPSMTVRTSPGY